MYLLTFTQAFDNTVEKTLSEPLCCICSQSIVLPLPALQWSANDSKGSPGLVILVSTVRCIFLLRDKLKSLLIQSGRDVQASLVSQQPGPQDINSLTL